MNWGETVSIEDVKCIQETAAALLCVIDGDEVWIPKSQIHDDSEVYDEGSSGTLVITEWIAREKGLV
jgi:hypothetical protein